MVSNIKAEVARYGLTLEKVAAELGMSTVSLSNKINGKAPWSLHEAKTLVEFFNSQGSSYTIETLFYPQAS